MKLLKSTNTSIFSKSEHLNPFSRPESTHKEHEVQPNGATDNESKHHFAREEKHRRKMNIRFKFKPTTIPL